VTYRADGSVVTSGAKPEYDLFPRRDKQTGGATNVKIIVEEGAAGVFDLPLHEHMGMLEVRVANNGHLTVAGEVVLYGTDCGVYPLFEANGGITNKSQTHRPKKVF